jgi:hypothetical protein
MEVRHLENGATEYVSDKAIVRIHPGKRTAEERQAALEEAAKTFYRAIQKSGNDPLKKEERK